MTGIASMDTVQVLYGSGGFVRLTVFGQHATPAEVIDLTAIAADLASLAIRWPRDTCEPRLANGEVEVDLGDGGRALWVSGGGDITQSELLWAVTAALEQASGDDWAAIAEVRRRRFGVFLIELLERLLEGAGLTARQRAGLFRRARRDLNGHSVRDVLGGDVAGDELRTAAFNVAFARASKAIGTPASLAWLAEHLRSEALPYGLHYMFNRAPGNEFDDGPDDPRPSA
jgi:hypothetical protein